MVKLDNGLIIFSCVIILHYTTFIGILFWGGYRLTKVAFCCTIFGLQGLL